IDQWVGGTGVLVVTSHYLRSFVKASAPPVIYTLSLHDALPVSSRFHTATRYLDFPGDFGDGRLFLLEMATMPLFSGLSEAWDGALAYGLDSRTQISAFGQIVATPDIQSLPLLRGSRQDRLNDPAFRPSACDGCNLMRDMVYLANVNFMRKYDGEFPRLDIS